MILSGVEFVVIFAAVYGLCLIVSHKREEALESRQQLLALKVRQQQVEHRESDDLWRASKRMRMI